MDLVVYLLWTLGAREMFIALQNSKGKCPGLRGGDAAPRSESAYGWPSKVQEKLCRTLVVSLLGTPGLR